MTQGSPSTSFHFSSGFMSDWQLYLTPAVWVVFFFASVSSSLMGYLIGSFYWLLVWLAEFLAWCHLDELVWLVRCNDIWSRLYWLAKQQEVFTGGLFSVTLTNYIATWTSGVNFKSYKDFERNWVTCYQTWFRWRLKLFGLEVLFKLTKSNVCLVRLKSEIVGVSLRCRELVAEIRKFAVPNYSHRLLISWRIIFGVYFGNRIEMF